MDRNWIIRNWGLLAAVLLLLPAALLAFGTLWRQSRQGRFRQAIAALRKAQARVRRAGRRAERLQRRVASLETHADTTRPRLLQERRNALDDAKALTAIARDQLLVAENHVRRLILEEYPPRRHAELRSKFLPDGAADKRPFSF